MFLQIIHVKHVCLQCFFHFNRTIVPVTRALQMANASSMREIISIAANVQEVTVESTVRESREVTESIMQVSLWPLILL